MFWGEDTPMMCMEEAGELIQAISKMERGKGKQQLIDEMGDMLICVTMLAYYYKVSAEDLEKRIRHKMDKKYDK